MPTPLFSPLPKWIPFRRLSTIRGNPTPSESKSDPDLGSPRNPECQSEVIQGNPNPSEVIRGDSAAERRKYFLPYQIKWLDDESPLRIMEKSRQVGISYVDAYDSVLKASVAGARFD